MEVWRNTWDGFSPYLNVWLNGIFLITDKA